MEAIETQTPVINELAKALAAAQAEITNAVKTSTNPFYHSRYADLATVMDACREPLSKQGLAVIQTTEATDGNMVIVVTTLAHSSGQWIRGRLAIKPVKVDPQGIGSAMTYARRYALAAMVGVAPEDDDGNSGSGKDDGRKSTQPTAKTTPPTKEKALPPNCTAAIPAAPDGKNIPTALQKLMDKNGITEKDLRSYMEERKFIEKGKHLLSCPPNVYNKMIEPANWKIVVTRIASTTKNQGAK